MRVVKIMGGLGNQMFEYAFARAMGDDVKTDITTFYENIDAGATPRTYQLDVFNTIKNHATAEQIAIAHHNPKLPKFICKLFHIRNHDVTEPDLRHHPEIMSRPTGYFIGYWQCEKYFAHIRQSLLSEFGLRIPLTPANRAILKQIKSVNSVSLHVRRGDYVQLQAVHGLCDIEYYRRAIEYIAAHTENPHFFVFSDDMDWVRENIPVPHPVTYVDVNDENTCCFDMELMKNCRHNIIANSSFSWWGAWLNENPDKIVVSPSCWFADGKQTDIIPDNWIRI